MPTTGMNDHVTTPSIDSEPPLALDKFIEQSGLSAVTVWRYRRAGWLSTLNICGRHYLMRSEIARFNARAGRWRICQELSAAKEPQPDGNQTGLKDLLGHFAIITALRQKRAAQPKDQIEPVSPPCSDARPANVHRLYQLGSRRLCDRARRRWS
jgi:hypothetical protein